MALTRVYNDILMNLDKQGGETVLLLLDLSSAFDTIDHTVFINRLRSPYGVGGAPLNWFSSYLHNRSQSVLVDNVRSQPVLVDFGMPQGSVCGPIYFILYTAPLRSIITRHWLSCMKYADDSQLYIISLNDSTQQNAIEKIETVSKMSKHGCHPISWFWTIAKLKLYTSLYVSLHPRNFLPPMLAKQLSNLHLKLEIWALYLIST